MNSPMLAHDAQPAAPEISPLMTTREVMAYLGVSRPTVTALRESKHIHGVRLGNGPRGRLLYIRATVEGLCKAEE